MSSIPLNISKEEIPAWVDLKTEKIEQYKADHPNYKEEIRLEEEKKNAK